MEDRPLQVTRKELLEKLARVAGRVVKMDDKTPFKLVGKFASEVAHEFDLTQDEQCHLITLLMKETAKGDGGTEK